MQFPPGGGGTNRQTIEPEIPVKEISEGSKSKPKRGHKDTRDSESWPLSPMDVHFRFRLKRSWNVGGRPTGGFENRDKTDE